MSEPIWQQQTADGPLVGVAVHHGHEIRDELLPFLALEKAERLREEDPFTGEWAAVAPNQVVGLRSRFEVDLNRPREQAIYRRPEDAWGLRVWKEALPDSLVDRSLAQYDAFYEGMYGLLSGLERRYGRFVIFDLHSYNHRRLGPDGPLADAADHPQVNVGTGTVDRSLWSGVIERFMGELQAHDYPGGRLDVRENVRFRGGHFARWVHQMFPRSGCVLAIEFKKFFMDEWTGQPDRVQVEAIGRALASTIDGVLQEFGKR